MVQHPALSLRDRRAHSGGGSLRQGLSNHYAAAASPGRGIPDTSHAVRQTATATSGRTQSRLDQSTRALKPGDSSLGQMIAGLQQCVSNILTSSGLRRTAQEETSTVTTFIWDGDDYLGEY